MLTIEANNAHCALPIAVGAMLAGGKEGSDGRVTYPEPVTLLYRYPQHRCLFWERADDVNPFRQFFRGLWTLAGKGDQRWFKPRELLLGECWIEDDQLHRVIKNIQNSPEGSHVLNTPHFEGVNGPDNMMVHFQGNPDKTLDMMVVNRADDLLHNDYVTFCMLLEYVATMTGLNVGKYWHTSYRWSCAGADLEHLSLLTGHVGDDDPYDTLTKNQPLTNLSELDMFTDEGTRAMGYRDPFFRSIAVPLLSAWNLYQEGDIDGALSTLKVCMAQDWYRSCRGWLTRKTQ